MSTSPDESSCAALATDLRSGSTLNTRSALNLAAAMPLDCSTGGDGRVLTNRALANNVEPRLGHLPDLAAGVRACFTVDNNLALSLAATMFPGFSTGPELTSVQPSLGPLPDLAAGVCAGLNLAAGVCAGLSLATDLRASPNLAASVCAGPNLATDLRAGSSLTTDLRASPNLSTDLRAGHSLATDLRAGVSGGTCLAPNIGVFHRLAPGIDDYSWHHQ